MDCECGALVTSHQGHGRNLSPGNSCAQSFWGSSFDCRLGKSAWTMTWSELHNCCGFSSDASNCLVRGSSLQGRRLRLSMGSRQWSRLVKIQDGEKKEATFCHKCKLFSCMIFYSILGRLQYGLDEFIFEILACFHLYINGSLWDVFVVYIFLWKVLTSFKKASIHLEPKWGPLFWLEFRPWTLGVFSLQK